ncbi:hypothetical protein H9Q89_19720 [Enterobacter cloacae]|uniref:hypothetical protein n=1 Tax=Enterobacter TaxID=547 RepID=UPI00164FFD18|nr:hypothetical protein [Enterobacter cloacae]EKX4033836.1 hypothetical protein [Enterobacter cloacae]MBC6340418.1 hypothetical protein [Enterobacter cloacae]MCK7386234.1 hypothetical protein [Enterobacter cloacae]HBL8955176.1 hypothetical protein [Enterobacter cloacae]
MNSPHNPEKSQGAAKAVPGMKEKFHVIPADKLACLMNREQEMKQTLQRRYGTA